MEGCRLTNENGKPVVPIETGDPYSWVKGLFQDEESVAELGDPAVWVRKGERVGVEFIPCCSEDRVFHKTNGWEYFYMYTMVFIDIGVRLPFTQFENGVLSQLKCAPTQIHPNAWAFIRGFEVLMEFLGQEPLLEVSSYKDFKQIYVKVRSPEKDFPFYIDECLLERFPLHWYSEPVQILEMVEVDEESALVIDFLDQYVCSKGLLSLNKLLRLEKEMDSVSEYLDNTTRGLKNFFKMKVERELSASTGPNAEKGVVVNQPSKKKRPISMKRRRAEGEASGKSMVIDLTNSKCCGKDVSLEEVKSFTRNQRKLHGYVGEEDLTSVWSEHFPFSVLAEEHFQLKTDFDLIGSVDDLTRAQYMQVAEKEKELLGLKNENADLNGKLHSSEKNKAELETRVVELCRQKKAAEVSKEEHGYDMLLAGFERAKKQAEFLFPDVGFDKLDPVKVVHNGALVDDDEVDVEGGGDHDPDS
ncbi:hypothetical protein PIB30_084529 [Stylosanthes scabra]|uniref:Transposase (Putative), gypsy type n=1 Tax=Stylosanthes scabra TaxID=79078 RepID=A0ABU6TUI8_9FABA|nr:hypothetical protein [Stylosanthes scabra]